MARPSQEAKILEAALTCFAERGYDGTRIKQIAERAGVTEGALYKHYESKEKVAQALYQEYYSQFSALLQEAVGLGEGLETRLRAVIKTGLEMYRDKPAAFNFVLLRSPNFAVTFPPGFVYPVEIIEAVMVEGQQQGLIRDGQPNLLAAIFLGCLLRPIIVSIGAAPHALDLLHETRHDEVIADAAWHAVAKPKDGN